MNLDQILSLSGDNGFYLETLDNELIQNGKSVFIQGLSLTFLNGQLTTVETLPIGNAGIPLQ